MRIHPDDERGMAMVIALLIAMVLLLLSTVVVQQSIHDSNSSAYDRTRLTSLNAAESGGNYFYAYLQSTAVTSISCNAVTQTVASSPVAATFTATPTFFDANGTAMSCASSTPFTSSVYPSAALIQTTGSVSGQAPRTMQTYIRLVPVRAGFQGAVVINDGTSFSNNFNINGNSGNDADVYILNGDLSISNAVTIRGNVYVPNGAASMSNGSNIASDLWANGNVSIANPASVSGSVTSSTGSISGSGSIATNATAATTITGVLVAGVKHPGTVSPQPPNQAFPQITFNAADWTDQGYTINTYSGATACSDARAFVEGSWTGNYVVRITGGTPCTYTASNNATVHVNGNLAIITDWGIDLDSQSNWNGTSSPTKGMFFISLWPSNSCPSGTSNKDVSVGNQTNFDTFTQVFFYTPCTATMSNSNNFAGQVMGKDVTLSNNFTMTYRPILVPGNGPITSFKENIAYIRESS